MHTILYVSTACKPFSQSDLCALLTNSRENNSKYGVTGLLLYFEGSFMQAIEGDENALRQLYRNICCDISHHSIIKLIDEPLEERNFPEWHMGFVNQTDTILNLQGFSYIFHRPASEHHILANTSHVKELLRAFRKSARI